MLLHPCDGGSNRVGVLRSCVAKKAPKFKKSVSKKRQMHTSQSTSTAIRSSHISFYHQTWRVYFMNIRCAWFEWSNTACINKVQERCRVCVRLLVAPKGPKPVAFVSMHIVCNRSLAFILNTMRCQHSCTHSCRFCKQAVDLKPHRTMPVVTQSLKLNGRHIYY